MLLIYFLQNEISTSDVVYIVLLKSGGDTKKEEAEYVYAWIYAICISFRIKKKSLDNQKPSQTISILGKSKISDYFAHFRKRLKSLIILMLK